jgi:ATP-binding cassette subfamily F protein 3
VRECLGGIYDFLEKKKLVSLQELERNKPSQSAAQVVAGNNAKSDASQNRQAAPAPSGKISYAEQRERDKMIKRSAKKVEEAEAEITRIEAAIADVEAKIAAGEIEGDIFDRHAILNRELENAMSLWEVASQDHDNLLASLKA